MQGCYRGLLNSLQTHYLREITAFLPVGVAHVSYEYWSVITITYWFPFAVRSNDTGMLMVVNSNGPLAMFSCNFPFSLESLP